MLKNNLFNRIFRANTVAANQCICNNYYKMLELSTPLLFEVTSSDSLDDLYELHKYAFKCGFQTNLGPDKYGMFRCSSIETMQPFEVFLGGIYGLNTRPITFWELHQNEPYNDKITCYDIVVLQYKKHLMSNIESITKYIQKELKALQKQGYIVK